MTREETIDTFFSTYDDQVFTRALQLREVLLKNLPDIIEQIDPPAKMVVYCYGQKYSDLVSVIIPSKNGLKLGFNKASELPDPEKLLEGNGKISRYVNIASEELINSSNLKKLTKSALSVYKQRMTIKKKKSGA